MRRRGRERKGGEREGRGGEDIRLVSEVTVCASAIVEAAFQDVTAWGDVLGEEEGDSDEGTLLFVAVVEDRCLLNYLHIQHIIFNLWST